MGQRCKSESHQLLINFDFARLDCLVRFEVDDHLPDRLPDNFKTEKDHVSSESNMEPVDLLESIQAATISNIHSAIPEQDLSAPGISKGGYYIPQCAMFDLTTRSAKKEKATIDILSEEMGQLPIRQTPNFALAYHTSGKFDDIRVQGVREEMKE